MFDSLFASATWLDSLAVLLPLTLLVWWRRRGERSASLVALALIGASTLGHLAKLVAAQKATARGTQAVPAGTYGGTLAAHRAPNIASYPQKDIGSSTA